jgi:hypothetical protein
MREMASHRPREPGEDAQLRGLSTDGTVIAAVDHRAVIVG